MRRAEIITAAILAVLSIYLMTESAKLDISYIRGEGPGGGAWPFWLSAVMLVCTGVIAFNWWRRTSPPSQSTDEFVDSYALRMLLLVGGGIIGFVALTSVISMYGAMMVFLFYYTRILGRHSWTLTLSMSLGLPIAFFFFFEALMRITLPKGMAFMDPLFAYTSTLIY